MKRNQPSRTIPADTPATRKRRLHKRLQEMTTKSEQELANLKTSIEQVKASFQAKEIDK